MADPTPEDDAAVSTAKARNAQPKPPAEESGLSWLMTSITQFFASIFPSLGTPSPSYTSSLGEGLPQAVEEFPQSPPPVEIAQDRSPFKPFRSDTTLAADDAALDMFLQASDTVVLSKYHPENDHDTNSRLQHMHTSVARVINEAKIAREQGVPAHDIIQSVMDFKNNHPDGINLVLAGDGFYELQQHWKQSTDEGRAHVAHKNLESAELYYKGALLAQTEKDPGIIKRGEIRQGLAGARIAQLKQTVERFDTVLAQNNFHKSQEGELAWDNATTAPSSAPSSPAISTANQPPVRGAGA